MGLNLINLKGVDMKHYILVGSQIEYDYYDFWVVCSYTDEVEAKKAMNYLNKLSDTEKFELLKEYDEQLFYPETVAPEYKVVESPVNLNLVNHND